MVRKLACAIMRITVHGRDDKSSIQFWDGIGSSGLEGTADVVADEFCGWVDVVNLLK